MKPSISNMWATVKGYCRTTAQTIFDKHDTNIIADLTKLKIFDHDISASIKSLQESSTTAFQDYVTLAYCNDCMSAIFYPVCTMLYDGNQLPDEDFRPYFLISSIMGKGEKISNINLTPFFPIIKPIAEIYSSLKLPYKTFSNLPKGRLTNFAICYWLDREHFGLTNDSTSWLGFKLNAYAAIIRKDKLYCEHYIENVLYLLYNKSVTITGTQNEKNTSWLNAAKMFNQIKNAIEIDKDYIHPAEKTPHALITIESPKNTTSNNKLALSVLPRNPQSVLQDALNDLNRLIGLSSVKEEVKRLTAFLAVQKERKKHGLPVANQTLHFVFKGNRNCLAPRRCG